jgi:hypothetical protein
LEKKKYRPDLSEAAHNRVAIKLASVRFEKGLATARLVANLRA